MRDLLLPWRGTKPSTVWESIKFDGLYVDVARHLSIEPDRIVTMDLDVDVVRRPDGTVEVLDLDDFELHRRHFGYPEELVTRVETTVDHLSRALLEYVTPFERVPSLPDRVA